MITSHELRKKFLDFFLSKNHAIIPSASLIPENDSTALFINSGMHPLVPYLLGEKHPKGTMLTDVQKCVRTVDIDEVGDATHLTFFEMLGNWSLGSYFKKEAIEWSFEFLTSYRWLNVPLSRLAVSVYKGDDLVPKDEESARIWKSMGIVEERIAYLGKEDNWWGPAGKTGPCGPDTEMFYWVQNDTPPPVKFDPSDKRWMEIWNDVFMQYNKDQSGNFSEMPQKNVDTGIGLERTLVVLNGLNNVYETDLFIPLFQKINGLKRADAVSAEAEMRAMRIIADHTRAAVFIIGDQRGVTPSNVDQGYILRRLIRRAVRQARLLEIPMDIGITSEVGSRVIDLMQSAYPELGRGREKILGELTKEEQKFEKTLEKGLKELKKFFAKNETPQSADSSRQKVDSSKAFFIFQSFGFPLEMIQEEVLAHRMYIDEQEFKGEFEKHQGLSRQGAEGKFSGGLADHSTATTRLHTATHLLHQALRDVLGDHVAQKGSNITEKRLRFDFSHPEKMTEDQKARVSAIVNGKIRARLPVKIQEMSVEDSQKSGAIGLFEHKYNDRVSVYFVGDYSKEVCGGPHVKNTSELAENGVFKIIKEEGVSAGVRRIKAMLEHF